MKPYLSVSLSTKAFEYKQNGCCLSLQDAVPNFQQWPSVFIKGPSPSSPSDAGFRRWEGPGQADEHLPHRWAHNATRANKQQKHSKRLFLEMLNTGRCSFAGFEVVKMWRWSGCLVLQRERIHQKAHREELEMKRDKLLPRAIFWALHQVLLRWPDYTKWLTPYDIRRFEAGFAILTIKRATNCQNFYFDPFHQLLTLRMNIILQVI